MTTSVAKANQYIEKNQDKVDERYRNQFHLMPPIGWMNDPNGFIYFKGEYHLFYQYHPYDSVWGPMHWGHAKSKDLLHWEDLPVALAPSEPYDKDGCFSGSAIEKDGKLYLMYTGFNQNGDEVEQVQCLAVSEDGIHFQKYSGNPIIDAAEIAGIATVEDFRDPKVFQRGDMYYSVVAAKTEDKRGQILLFESVDLLQWQFKSVLLEGGEEQGIMWECPDLFHLDGKDVLILSPIQMAEEGFAYKNTSSTVAFIGTVDWQFGKFLIENYHEIDSGLDFYAPQTCLDNQNNRVMVAWMQMWHRTMPTHELNHFWAGAMTLPRLLHIENQRLVQQPIPSLYTALTDETVIEEVQLDSEEVVYEDFVFSQQYLKIEIDNTTLFNTATLKYGVNQTSALLISYDKENSCLTVSREGVGHRITGSEKVTLVSRSIAVNQACEKLVIEIIRDTSSLEVFINQQDTMTMTFYEESPGKDFSISTDGKVRIPVIQSSQIK